MKTPRDTTADSALNLLKIFLFTALIFGAALSASTGAKASLSDVTWQESQLENALAYRSRYLRFNEYLFNGRQRGTAVV